MNAYELADALQETEPYYSTDYKLFDNAANMLRQQADRIAELERTLSIMEGEYPEPTIFAKITEFNSLEEAYKRIAKYEQVLQSIANEQVELSHDKIKWQCEDHIRWAREALK